MRGRVEELERGGSGREAEVGERRKWESWR